MANFIFTELLTHTSLITEFCSYNIKITNG